MSFFGGTAWAECVNRAFRAGGGEHEQVTRFVEGEIDGIERIVAFYCEAFLLRPGVNALVVMIDEVELACRVDGCAGNREKTVFQFLHFCSGGENGRCVRRYGQLRIACDVQDSELALAHFEMIRQILNSVFVGELA